MDAIADKRSRILAAATELIVESGLQFPMSTISAKANVATGSIYNYFASKEELTFAVYGELAAYINNALVHEIDLREEPRARVIRYIYEYIDCFWSDARRAVLFEYLSNVPLIPAVQFDTLFHPVNTYVIRIVELAQDAGLLRKAPATLLAPYIGGGIRNTLKWHRMRHSQLTNEQREQIALTSWYAIAEPGT
ncbi:TetR/AcrR family transcriptional regulator [Rhizobium sp. L1K21]|uniref:TetR/AcrR family transcriptional regulator n=1 Tax=Rhizobium sp. L1K21 TaxID=2954933 RepID=UPI002093E43C|nr:TetR/AcrR family transcriptional regulator [Rhizobium sp. L1K21]MCO6187606.1 TetR/AcrR family transcriptional regulator [Rhizobium sp. L1K21]